MRRQFCIGALLALLALLALMATAVPAAAQTAPPDQGPPKPLRVFMDCYECDTEFLRQNLLFVDYVRDRLAADLHVLVTTQSTGSGGSSWTLKLIGVGRFQGQDRTTTFTTPQSATNDDRRREFARVFRLALAGYAATTGVARDLDVTFTPETTVAPKAAVKDPWNFWVYRISGNGSMNGEASSQSRSYRFSVSASRVTEKWKMSASANTNVNKRWFKLSDGRKVNSDSDSSGIGGTIVRSAGPRFSVGMRMNVNQSSFSNIDRSASIYPGFEFNFFPYAQFQQRSFTIWYEVGPNFYKYRELTVYDKLSERVTKQQMDISYRVRQTWGSMSAFASFSQQLRHLDRYSANINMSADIRVFKGFSFNVFGGYSRIKDQIGLAKGGATTEEILLRLRQLATDYSYHFSTGFSYTFGSIFNSVVNPRYGG
jgi:hypothetical protein